jgi:hypothetical protein
MSKSESWFKVKAAMQFKPQAYLKYVEDLKCSANAEIGPIGLFDISF